MSIDKHDIADTEAHLNRPSWRGVYTSRSFTYISTYAMSHYEYAVMDENDERLLEQVRLSDEDAFQLLYKRYQPILFRTALHALRDADAAHDIVQEVFIRVWNHRSSLRPSLPFLAYLFRISRNLLRDRAKHDEVRKRFELDNPHPSLSAGDDPDESLQVRMLQEALSEVVTTTLPARCREIFLLSRMEGMSNAEISARLGISVKTVENQITRGLKILRRHLRSYTS
ncbi:MAG: polymerase sigma-70 factor [Bacteroidetes bacterium]|nr:polymerase sigma-70 factor [Bacteroidota bacterium]